MKCDTKDDFSWKEKKKNNHHFYQFVKYCNLKSSLDDIVYHIMLRYKTPTVAVSFRRSFEMAKCSEYADIVYFSRVCDNNTLGPHVNIIHK